MGTQNRASIFLSALLLFTPMMAKAAPCGDVDDSGSVVSSDALSVLRRAVQLPDAELTCDACVVPTTTSSTCCYDECFNDEDCPEAGYPSDWVCGGEYNAFCVECRSGCPGDNECVNWRCINGCGDFDANGKIAASDALIVLKAAVGQEIVLRCPGCTE